MRLKRLNILVIILLILLLGGLLLIFWESSKELVKREALRSAQMEAGTIIAFRHYLAEANQELLTALEDKNLSNPFMCAPAYVTSHAVKNINGFLIRQVSDNPRNPKNRAEGIELDAIHFFRTYKDRRDYFSSLDKNGTSYYFYAYPLKIEKSCLKCHGVVGKDVSYSTYRKIKKIYGDRGFGYHLGDVRGILAIYIPKDSSEQRLAFLKTRALLVIGLYVVLIIFIVLIHIEMLNELKKFEQFFSNDEKASKIEKINFSIEEFKNIQSHLINYLKKNEKYQEELKHMAVISPLTQLENLTAFSNWTQEGEERGELFTVIAFDVDNFKNINQTFGFQVGNKLVKEIAERLKNLVRKIRGAKVFHLDIDRFAVVLPVDWSKKEVEELTEELLKKLEEPYPISLNGENQDEIVVSFRTGIAYRKQTPLPKISFALEEAKAQQKEILFYDDVKDKRGDYKEHLKLLQILRKAITTGDADGIIPFYQPIVDRNRKVVRFEALVRLINLDTGEIITPYKFLKVAKSSRLYGEITKIMIRKVLCQFTNLNYGVSLNLSVEDAENEEIRRFILKKLKEFPDPSRVGFEIVEDEYAGNSEEVREFFRTLKKMGCKIYIDDFGSGYANFEYLIKLNADGVKIDGSLIKNILHDKGSEVTVKSVLNFTKEMGMESIGEFVENEEIFEKLKELGVDYFQGYYFSKPVRYLGEFISKGEISSMEKGEDC